ncbi:hypothetical protein ACSQ67_021058 [Phaseolus vulgaris]
MQAMYSSVARELKTTQLTDEHPQDYLNFYSLSNREDFNEESSSTWCTDPSGTCYLHARRIGSTDAAPVRIDAAASLVLAKLSKPKEGNREGEASSGNSGGDSPSSESRLAGKKVKLPSFDGEDPSGLDNSCGNIFRCPNTPEDMRVKLSRLSMEGPTIHWFNLSMETEDRLSWEKLKRALIARYGGGDWKTRLKNYPRSVKLEELKSLLKHLNCFPRRWVDCRRSNT